jgi:hypothetical protein
VNKKMHRIKILREINKLVQLRDQRNQRSSSRSAAAAQVCGRPGPAMTYLLVGNPCCHCMPLSVFREFVELAPVITASQSSCSALKPSCAVRDFFTAQAAGEADESKHAGGDNKQQAQLEAGERELLAADERDRMYTTEHKLLFDTVGASAGWCRVRVLSLLRPSACLRVACSSMRALPSTLLNESSE